MTRPDTIQGVESDIDKAKEEAQTRATEESEKVTGEVKAASPQEEAAEQRQQDNAAEAAAADSDEFEWTVLNSEAGDEDSKQVCLIIRLSKISFY